MSVRDNGGPAFPMQEPQAIHAYAAAAMVDVVGTDERDRVYAKARAEAVGGMSLRDYFAAKAMHAQVQTRNGFQHSMSNIAALAYYMADAMLEERSK